MVRNGNNKLLLQKGFAAKGCLTDFLNSKYIFQNVEWHLVASFAVDISTLF